jgi:hypothetical protein
MDHLRIGFRAHHFLSAHDKVERIAYAHKLHGQSGSPADVHCCQRNATAVIAKRTHQGNRPMDRPDELSQVPVRDLVGTLEGLLAEPQGVSVAYPVKIIRGCFEYDLTLLEADRPLVPETSGFFIHAQRPPQAGLMLSAQAQRLTDDPGASAAIQSGSKARSGSIRRRSGAHVMDDFWFTEDRS